MQCQQEYYVGISTKISTNVLFQFDEFTEKGDKNPLRSREKKMNGVIPSRFDRILNITFFTQKKKK